LVMQDKHTGFFAYVALAIPIAMLGLAINIVLGLGLAVVILLSINSTSHDKWAEVGQTIDTKSLTFVVLIGGSCIVCAQAITGFTARML
jgi:hypothetical protein